MTLTRFQSKTTNAAEPAATSPNAPAEAVLSGDAPVEPAPKVHVVTFGCQMNKYDSLLAEGRFVRRGYAITGDLHDADVVLFNTCSVREHAEERTYSWLGELKRAKEKRPDLVIGVMGCMAQRVGEEIFARAGHVDIVAGTRQFASLPELVDRVRDSRAERSSARILATSMEDALALDRSDERYDGSLHAYLTVMRGCDLNCTFCIVPTVRGRVMSYPIDHLVREARWLVAGGARVITLLGQTVNSYGEDFDTPRAGEPRGRGRQGRASLADLLYRLQEVEGLARIRLITLHPSYVTDALALAIAECDKVDRFLPLPAQSGSDTVLRAMKRGYTVDLYRRRTDLLRARVPDIELGSDWIVGFPGESDDDFRCTEALLDELGFAASYVFKYDPRPGTSACSNLADDVPDEVKRERNQRLLERTEATALKALAKHVGAVRTAFVESVSTRSADVLLARTHHNLPVQFARKGNLASDLLGANVELRIDQASAFGLSGSLV